MPYSGTAARQYLDTGTAPPIFTQRRDILVHKKTSKAWRFLLTIMKNIGNDPNISIYLTKP
jgi:hypothetical protein